MDGSSQSRRYFTVIDDQGRHLPVVEYWAASLSDDDLPPFQVMPLRRYVKVMGTGDYLRATADGAFIEVQSGRRYRSTQTSVDIDSID
ncbi:hypothetical protein JI739_16660 [Ramlibacter sp. AW1]|uniref:Uncharacterized protein n=1 Tax=Ramlibacter aurantiacus TaxID=2801330 RepID=A0A937D2U7_9BURK|nr:hypothetical protein [Ramlibacter aurantiacus]MBL0421984.1 hypothetical protein [Ramlibacter aurantiacus]